MKNYIIIIFILTTFLFGNKNIYTIEDKDINGKTIIIENTSYKILQFSKRIVDIRLSKSDELSVIFLENNKNPFSQIKVFAKKVGHINALITFNDNTTSQIYFNIIPDIKDIKLLIKNIAKNVNISHINNTIILKGKVKNNKVKDKILLILKESASEFKVVNLLEIDEPDKMVKLKLYVAEINNREGETIKNNWSLAGFNDGKTSSDISANMLSAVTLSGGITATANRLGSKFNTGLTLNYLKENGVAKILDETTLVTLENKIAEFLAGGTLLIETASTSADGQPISTITEINYGLSLNITVKEIINNKYINLEIDTSSSTLDPANGVGSMPAKKEKSIKTNVVIENKSTVILGGLINNNNSKDWEKIPLLGDIPVIGKLFQSKAFKEGQSELVFFITPIIVDTSINNQNKVYEKMKNKIVPIPKKKTKVIKKVIPSKKKTKQLTNEELHKQRIKDLFNI